MIYMGNMPPDIYLSLFFTQPRHHHINSRHASLRCACCRLPVSLCVTVGMAEVSGKYIPGVAYGVKHSGVNALPGIAACRLCIFVAVTAVKIIFFML